MSDEYEKLLQTEDVKRAIAAEKEFLKNGGKETLGEDPGLDQGYNQWVEFDIEFDESSIQNFAVKEDDVKIDCGKLYQHGAKSDKIKNYPVIVYKYPKTTIGACGRSCAAVGTVGKIGLCECTDYGKTIGDDVVIYIEWKCTWHSYGENYLHAWTQDPRYEVTFNQNYTKRDALGIQKIKIVKLS